MCLGLEKMFWKVFSLNFYAGLISMLLPKSIWQSENPNKF